MSKIESIQKIVDEKQCAKVEGYTLDLFSASAILNVYRALGEENRSNYVSMPIPTMARFAFKLLK